LPETTLSQAVYPWAVTREIAPGNVEIGEAALLALSR
jgi:hypothetical protein